MGSIQGAARGVVVGVEVVIARGGYGCFGKAWVELRSGDLAASLLLW